MSYRHPTKLHATSRVKWPFVKSFSPLPLLLLSELRNATKHLENSYITQRPLKIEESRWFLSSCFTESKITSRLLVSEQYNLVGQKVRGITYLGFTSQQKP